MPSGYSVLEYQGDGVTDIFAVNFTLGYLNKSDIYCRVGEEVDGTGQPAYRELESIPGDPGRMRVLGDIPTASQKVLFRRITSKTVLENDYADGESLDDDALDNSFRQGIMLSHELLDGFGLSTVYSDIDLTGHKIVNVQTDANDPTSLCNVQYAGQAPVHSAAAQASATAAAASATSAHTSAAAALVSQVAAEAAAAGVPDASSILTKTGNLAGLSNPATARGNLGLGTAAVVDVGTGAGQLVQINESGQLPAVNAALVTGLSALAKFATVANRVLYVNSAGEPVWLALGAAGTVLQSNGASVAPTFEEAAAGWEWERVSETVVSTSVVSVDFTGLDFTVYDYRISVRNATSTGFSWRVGVGSTPTYLVAGYKNSVGTSTSFAALGFAPNAAFVNDTLLTLIASSTILLGTAVQAQGSPTPEYLFPFSRVALTSEVTAVQFWSGANITGTFTLYRREK